MPELQAADTCHNGPKPAYRLFAFRKTIGEGGVERAVPVYDSSLARARRMYSAGDFRPPAGHRQRGDWGADHMAVTHYESLGLPSDATPDEIKRRYRKLARLFHPDVNQDTELREYTEMQMRTLNAAYEVLRSRLKISLLPLSDLFLSVKRLPPYQVLSSFLGLPRGRVFATFCAHRLPALTPSPPDSPGDRSLPWSSFDLCPPAQLRAEEWRAWLPPNLPSRQPAHHEMNHRHIDHGFTDRGQHLILFA